MFLLAKLQGAKELLYLVCCKQMLSRYCLGLQTENTTGCGLLPRAVFVLLFCSQSCFYCLLLFQSNSSVCPFQLGITVSTLVEETAVMS